MISPHTAPGTKVVCVLDRSSRPLPELTVGHVYVVDRIVECIDGFGASLIGFGAHHDRCQREHRWRLWEEKFFFYYDLELLQRLDLPSILTDALTSQPLVHDADLEVVS